MQDTHTEAAPPPMGWRWLIPDTANGKIVGAPRRAIAAATYLPIANTCDPACPMLTSRACYALAGHVGLINMARETAARGMTARDLARELARELRAAILLGLDDRPLRMFVAGDMGDVEGAREISEACAAWRGPVWGYTHHWRRVPRDAWGRVAMLASCESASGARDARARGYVPAIVVGKFPRADRAWEHEGARVVPCPQQSRDVPCVDCGLCWRASTQAIAFTAHGPRARDLARRLPIVGAP